MRLDLVFPCQENMDRMPNTEKGKFCHQCSKEVIDFTEMSKEDIIQILSKKKSCGIYRTDQIDRVNEPVVYIRPKKHIVRLAVASLSVFVLSLFGCTNEPKISKVKTHPIDSPQNSIDTTNCKKLVGEMPRPKIEEVKTIGDTIIISEPIISKGQTMISGMMAPLPPDKEDSTTDVYGTVESMPEFPGGEDSMMTFLKNEVRYPKESIKNNVQGIVYVQFVVEENGEITNSKILRGLSIAIDREALRVIRNMPKWKPGHNDGKPAAVSFVLPIAFELD